MTKTGANQESEEAAGNVRTADMITGVEDEGDIMTEERKEICSGATLMATHAYTRQPDSHIWKEIYLQQWDTLVFKGEHADNEHWRLVEDIDGQVGYAPAAFLVVILDTTAQQGKKKATIPRRDERTVQRKTGLEEGLDWRENEGRVTQRQ